ncbi:alpha/beta fold hydrolase [Candidatus Amarolinea aalborgensis]|jgi:pimeloyl-ACP methyl ester carboxylesterase|uniref:alpha/beta fold hydrolase n=1 Tax=Candidatus Amarolinea aalborgensis TaxID=2249329 RepID=UPI003BF9826A
MKTKRLLWLIPLLLLILLVGGFLAWTTLFAAAPMPEAVAEMQASTTLAGKNWLVFQPAAANPTTGLILYPGGLVDARAYAPAARQIAEAGYLVVIVPMPLKLAFFDAGRASEVMQAFPSITHWAIGGHSLGGAMAAQYAYQHPDQVAGLALWAAYPAANNSLADRALPVVSIYGTRDGLATGGKIDASRPLLPANTRFVAIEGGNHAQFGWYGKQSGDNEATIPREAQQAQIVAATVSLLSEVAK